MRYRGLCKANVDAVATAPREHEARRVQGRRVCGIRQRRYWAMLIGGSSRASARPTRVRVTRRGSGHHGVVGRDMSIDPYR